MLGFMVGMGLVVVWMCVVIMFMGVIWYVNLVFSGGVLLLVCLFYLFNNFGEELVYCGYLFFWLIVVWGFVVVMLVMLVVFVLLYF